MYVSADEIEAALKRLKGPVDRDEATVMAAAQATADALRGARIEPAPPSSVAERGGLRAALDAALGTLDEDDVHYHTDHSQITDLEPHEPTLYVPYELLRERLAATPVAATLDVERLARAISETERAHPLGKYTDGEYREWAEEIAAAYSALASEGGE